MPIDENVRLQDRCGLQKKSGHIELIHDLMNLFVDTPSLVDTHRSLIVT
ncbi:MAG: hypothetical protein OXF84_13465 [Bacteroidetes bacterium]|nr:hypothetical protein [Bacteroidota bacterium]